VAEALAERLAEPDGPEVVLISTGRSPSWFDQLTMDRARTTMIWRLTAADVFGRFRAFYPVTSGGSKIIVHSKVMVIDDELARVGSANLNNRSGGFDTECDLTVLAQKPEDRLAIAAFRDRLVGHFMAVTGDAVSKARADHGGLCAAIDALNRDGRLTPLKPRKMSALGEFIAAYHIGDPANVGDSWRLGRRREKVYAEARKLADERAQALLTKPRNP
jgi:phosphatidylserine/phosphatidylglycerophosphate/cardiolipin synthase-like enzyme